MTPPGPATIAPLRRLAAAADGGSSVARTAGALIASGARIRCLGHIPPVALLAPTPRPAAGIGGEELLVDVLERLAGRSDPAPRPLHRLRQPAAAGPARANTAGQLLRPPGPTDARRPTTPDGLSERRGTRQADPGGRSTESWETAGTPPVAAVPIPRDPAAEQGAGAPAAPRPAGGPPSTRAGAGRARAAGAGPPDPGTGAAAGRWRGHPDPDGADRIGGIARSGDTTGGDRPGRRDGPDGADGQGPGRGLGIREDAPATARGPAQARPVPQQPATRSPGPAGPPAGGRGQLARLAEVARPPHEGGHRARPTGAPTPVAAAARVPGAAEPPLDGPAVAAPAGAAGVRASLPGAPDDPAASPDGAAGATRLRTATRFADLLDDLLRREAERYGLDGGLP